MPRQRSLSTYMCNNTVHVHMSVFDLRKLYQYSDGGEYSLDTRHLILLSGM